MNDPAERMGKAMYEMFITQKQCYEHYRLQLYPHFVHRGFYLVF